MNNEDHCRHCGRPMVRLRDDGGKPIMVMGREFWVCERFHDTSAPCDGKSFRQPGSGDSEQGRCPHCGCQHLLEDKVTWSVLAKFARRRRRICRNCKLPVYTREIVADN